MRTGGWADKLGNRYEGLWTAKQLLLLLQEKLMSVQLEKLDDVDDGIDLTVAQRDGQREAQQCKKNDTQNNWTIRGLAARGVLTALRVHLLKDTSSRFVFVSNREATSLKRLIERARKFDGHFRQFLSSLGQAKTDKEDWRTLCEKWSYAHDISSAFELLLRSEVTVFGDGPRTRYDVENLAELLIIGDPRDVVLRLADFAVQRMGQPIHADELRRFLHEHTTYQLRDLTFTPAIIQVIKECRQKYRRSIDRFLIEGQLLDRSETEPLLDEIIQGTGPRIYCLHGTAGQGKSCLLHALTLRFEQRDIPYLPLRLDQLRPTGNTREYGKLLGFPESPMRCFHAMLGERRGVVVLDQLDALRWTAQHDSSSWSVFEKLIEEALQLGPQIAVVVACRSFDLQHDPNISAWRNADGQRTLLKEVPIAALSAEVTRAVVEAKGVAWSALTIAQQKLLCRPLHLYLWTRLSDYPSTRTVFRTSTDLMRAFWQHVRRQLEVTGLASSEIEQALQAIANRLDKDGRPTAPAQTLDWWPSIRDALASLTVIEINDDTVRFAHGSYFDYYLAELWLERLRKDHLNIHAWLSPMDEQSLLRRSQLRQLLTVMRDDDPGQFLQAVQDILKTPQVRFHLKQLTLQFIGFLTDPNPDEVTFIADLLEIAEWRDAVEVQVLLGHPAWFRALDKMNIWERWLQSDESWRVDLSLRVFRFVSEDIADRLAELLSPVVDRSDTWLRRIGSTLGFTADHDSPKLFQLRLRLVRCGCPDRAELFLSEQLLHRDPQWLVDLVAAALARDRDCEDKAQRERITRNEYWPYWIPHSEAKTLLSAAEIVPRYFWEQLFPFVHAAIEANPLERHFVDYPPFLGDELWQKALYRHEHGGVRPLPELLSVAGGKWASNDLPGLTAALEPFLQHPSRTMQQVIGTLWLSAPDGAADIAMEWLLENTDRFRLGCFGEDTTWRLARNILLRFAALCSDKVYARLETVLLSHYSAPERLRFRHRIGDGVTSGLRRYDFGYIQHALLPALPEGRRSLAVVNATGQLQQKFTRPAEEMEGDDGPRGGTVTSPIGPRKSVLSDGAWLRLMQSKMPNAGIASRRYYRDHVIESSHEEFSRDFSAQAARQPRRFAALVHRIPPKANPSYLAALLDALRLTQPPSQTAEDWQSATDTQRCDVLRHIGYNGNAEIAMAYCRCVAAHADVRWPEEIVGTVARIAREHPDPREDGQVVPNETEDRLEIEAINTARACAAATLEAILFRSPTLLPHLRPTIEHLIRDQVSAVRVAAIGTLHPVLNIDRNQAVAWFLDACTGAQDEVLASRSARQFLAYAIQSHGPQLDSIFDRMLRSTNPSIAAEGAAWVTVIWLHSNQRGEEYVACAAGATSLRRAVAEILSHHVSDERVRLKCNGALPQFFSDPDRKARDASVSFLRSHLDWSQEGTICMAHQYVKSQSFLDDPTRLLWELEGYRGDLIPLAQLLFVACDRLTDPENNEQIRGWAHDVEKLFHLLLRLYGAAQPGKAGALLRKECLDRWDSILRIRGFTLSTILVALDA